MHKRKHRILIKALGSSSWIGGLYYANNIAYQLSCNDTITDNNEIYILTTQENKEIFSDLPSCINVLVLRGHSRICKFIDLGLKICRYRFDYVFPTYKSYPLLGINGISWIPDFQHNRLPEMFSAEEIQNRNKTFREVAGSRAPLVLSSQTALKDFREFYSHEKSNVFVVPFVSFINKKIETISEREEAAVLEKYNLQPNSYVCLMNQFWKHKNHLIVFRALKNVVERNPDSKIKLVCTGFPEDYRNPEYSKEIQTYLEMPILANRILLLGFIDRVDQLVIMKNSKYVVQPSLFEGWGTVLEDAKVLDKTVLLSDIPVHREQKNGKCKLFDPNNSEELAQLMEIEYAMEHNDDIHIGIRNMQVRAKEYSIGFQKMLGL